MKFIITILISWTIFLSLEVSAQAVSVVNDRNVNRQLENMVFMRWGGFRPKWYYFLFHNKYRKGPDRRTLLQLVPTDVVVRQTEAMSEDEQDEVQRMYAMQNYDAMNRALELHYHFHLKPLFDDLNNEIDQLQQEATDLNAGAMAIEAFEKEQERLNEEVEIIRRGWLEKGDSAEAMKRIEADLRKLKGDMLKFVQLQTINQKYQDIQP